MKPPPRLLTLAAVTTTLGLLGSGIAALPTATAADQGQGEIRSHVTLDRAAIAQAKRNSASSPAAKKAKDKFLEEQARAGTLWDDTEVSAAAVQGVTAAWSNNVVVDQVETAEVTQADGEETAEIQVIAAPEDAGGSAEEFQAGSGSLDNVTGQVSGSRDGGAITIQVSGHYLTTAWERYKVAEGKDDRNVFYYGHWATATGKVLDNDVDHYPGTIDLRSRPTDGHAWKFMQGRNWWPKDGDNDCGSSNLGVGILGFSASFPLGNCSGFVVTPNMNTPSMKTVWNDGACRDNRSESADLGLAVDVQPDTGVAMLSDYSYARFNNGVCDTNDNDGDIRVIHTDPGW